MSASLLAGLGPSWTSAIGTVALGAGGLLTWLYQRRKDRSADAAERAKRKAERPIQEVSAMSAGAEAIARAATALIEPLQKEIQDLRDEVTTSRTAEEKCQRDLAEVRTKLREVTDHLGLGPSP